MSILAALEKNPVTSLIFGKNDSTSVQFIKYACVGGAAYSIDFATLFFLTEFCRVHYLLSAAVGFLLGLLVNYSLSISWVFSKRSAKDKRTEFLVFAAIGLIGLGLNEFIIWFFTEGINLYYILSKLVATGIVFLWNFFARKKILFS